VAWWRYQFPVYSPLSGEALLGGLRAALTDGHPERTAAPVIALLHERYSPTAVLLTDSGTAALTAALIGALGDAPGAAVALPAFGCYDLATAADGARVPVLLYDLNPRNLAPDPESVRSALRRGARAIVVAHLYGCPVDLTDVNRLAAESGARVIEDAAQAAGATLGEHPVGSDASLAVLSFGRGKGLTGGGGGALLAYDEAGARTLEGAQALLSAPRRGWQELVALAAQLLLVRPNLYAVPATPAFFGLGQTVYREPRRLRGPTAASCGVIAATWQRAAREVESRQRNAERLLAELRRQRGFATIHIPQQAQPGYLRLPVLASAAVRQAAAQPTAKRLGVMPSYPKALCDLDGFGSRCLNGNLPFPGSRLLAARLCTLPTHSRLGASDLTRLEQWIRSVGAL
jgi:dTDP-4-amino-4,6-dideoxygalactose transaminase